MRGAKVTSSQVVGAGLVASETEMSRLVLAAGARGGGQS